MALTAKDFDAVINKLHMTARDTKHRFVWFEYAGRKILYTERSHGRGDLGSVEFAIRRQLKVNARQMQDLVDCPMTRDGYVEHLKQRGDIEP